VRGPIGSNRSNRLKAGPVTTHMNDLNTKLQRQAQYANEMYGHIKGFMNKFRLWQVHIQDGNLCHFPTLKETGMRPEKKTEFADQLEKLLNEFLARFKDFKSHEHLFEIFSSPFHTDVDKAPADIQMELIDLQERTDLKAKYVEVNLGDFYRKYLDQDKFPNLRKFMASKTAFSGSTYLCEQFFFKMGFMKSPYQSVLTDEHLENGLRVASTSIKVNLDKVVNKKRQLHISHRTVSTNIKSLVLRCSDIRLFFLNGMFFEIIQVLPFLIFLQSCFCRSHYHWSD